MSESPWSLPYTIPFNDAFEEFMCIFAIIASSYSVFQVYDIVKKKTTAAVSWPSWTIITLSNVFWIFYGLMVEDLVVLLSSIVPVIGGCAILVLFLVYPNRIPPRRIQSHARFSPV